MAKVLQLRRGNTSEMNSFTGAEGELTYDTQAKFLVIHDGITVGGFPQATKANADGTISLIKKDGTNAGSINSSGLFNNTLTSTNTDQALTAAQGKVLKDLTDTKLNSSSIIATGSAPFYVARAWVNFNGSGTVAIKASGNVSSITDNGVGDFTINLTTALDDSNYAMTGVSNTESTFVFERARTANSVRIGTKLDDGGFQDSTSISVMIIR